MKKVYFAIPCLIALGLFLVTRLQSRAPEETAAEDGNHREAVSQFQFVPAPSAAPAKAQTQAQTASRAADDSPRTVAVQSLSAMTETLSQFSKPTQKFEDLLEDLSTQHMQPYVARTANPYTGEVMIARTQNPLPGTRYFYAQYAGSGDDRVLEHMSFEFQPGESAMNDAVAAVKQSFQTSLPIHEGPDFKEWDAGNGYVVWVKKQNENDLKNRPINAYDKSDIGTVLVAVEINQDEDSE